MFDSWGLDAAVRQGAPEFDLELTVSGDVSWQGREMDFSKLDVLPAAGRGLDAIGSPCASCGPLHGSWTPEVAAFPGSAGVGLGPVVSCGVG